MLYALFSGCIIKNQVKRGVLNRMFTIQGSSPGSLRRNKLIPFFAEHFIKKIMKI